MCFLRLILYIQVLMYRNLDFHVKSVAAIGVLLVSNLMLFFFRQKIVAIFGKKIAVTPTPKHVAALILWFLLQLKVIA